MGGSRIRSEVVVCQGEKAKTDGGWRLVMIRVTQMDIRGRGIVTEKKLDPCAWVEKDRFRNAWEWFRGLLKRITRMDLWRRGQALHTKDPACTGSLVCFWPHLGCLFLAKRQYCFAKSTTEDLCHGDIDCGKPTENTLKSR